MLKRLVYWLDFLVVGEDRHEVLTPCIHIKQAISAEVDYQAVRNQLVCRTRDSLFPADGRQYKYG